MNFSGQEVSTTSSKESVKLSNSRILRRKKSNYKHVPHCEKPPQVVAKRNARERRRVQAVNQAFIQLRKAIPIESKVKKNQNVPDYCGLYLESFYFKLKYSWNAISMS